MKIRADLRNGTTAVEKAKLLKGHLSARTGNTQPHCVIGVVVFCDGSLLSLPSGSDGLVSIEMLGYVQAKNATPQSTMKKWIDSATWKQVPGGLTSDKEYMSKMRRFQDPNDELTRLVLFGSIGANNVGRSEEKAAKRKGRKVGRPDRARCDTAVARQLTKIHCNQRRATAFRGIILIRAGNGTLRPGGRSTLILSSTHAVC